MNPRGKKPEEEIDVPNWVVMLVCLGSFALLVFLGSLVTAFVIWVLGQILPGQIAYSFSLLGGLCFGTIVLWETIRRAFV